MHYRYLAVLAQMGMRVDVGRLAVSCPAGVAYPYVPIQVALVDYSFEYGQPAFPFYDLEIPAAVNGDPGRVVPAILQPLQSVHYKRYCVIFSDISDYPAHKMFPLKK